VKPPVSLGHAFCGVVERVGREVARVCGSSTIFAAETNRERHRMAFAIDADVAMDSRKDDAVALMESETSGTDAHARSKTESAMARHLKVHS
jgi:threonine dehydrogenase-like Zn-dependent dehydrogenase